jgi:hypothetical protein
LGIGAKRPTALAALAFGAAGLLVGLADFRNLVRFPLERYEELLKFPHPLTTTWWSGIQGPATLLDSLESPLTALLIALVLLGFGLLARLLGPGYRPFKPPEENPGRGATSHLDTRLLWRSAAGAVPSLWLLGLLTPIGFLLPERAGRGAALLVLGGLPAWCNLIPGVLGVVVHSLLLAVCLWLIWGPGGVPPRSSEAGPRESLVWGLLAGAAALPAVLALYRGRFWIGEAAGAYSLADSGSWSRLMLASVALPAAAAVLLALLAARFRPRALERAKLLPGGALALGAAGAAVLGSMWVGSSLNAIDANRHSLAAALKLPDTPLRRFAVLLTPDGRAMLSITDDGSRDVFTGTCIPCNTAVNRVEEFLRGRRFRTQLASAAYMHLRECAALDWLDTRSIEMDLMMLEGAPTPAAARLLLEKLADCRITEDNRRLLHRVTDPALFAWPSQLQQWLGAVHIRFGELEKGRAYFMNSGMTQAELVRVLGGITPLTAGTIRGRLTIQGRAPEAVRVGALRFDRWREMAGPVRPHAWRHVTAAVLTDAQGRFEIKNLPEGRYVLVVTGGGIGRIPGEPAAAPHPGIIHLDRFRATQTLETFDIRFQRRPTAPDSATVRAPGRSGAPRSAPPA